MNPKERKKEEERENTQSQKEIFIHYNLYKLKKGRERERVHDNGLQKEDGQGKQWKSILKP